MYCLLLLQKALRLASQDRISDGRWFKPSRRSHRKTLNGNVEGFCFPALILHLRTDASHAPSYVRLCVPHYANSDGF